MQTFLDISWEEEPITSSGEPITDASYRGKAYNVDITLGEMKVITGCFS